MTQKSTVHKCRNCGCIVAVIHGGEGNLSCCGRLMEAVTPSEAKKLVYGMSRPGAPQR
jgi:desulfoferrodoxin-like iron-binding protein